MGLKQATFFLFSPLLYEEGDPYNKGRKIPIYISFQ